ncbi:alpha/beta fold hydrolase [Aspergillus fijiensis CBS 313.89]|uniref:Alpha/beta-hydrolase n=1 Tax=Aspergillus fijiensis CBS 313.89 TaxID=1448319 RepID=A0A8G1RFX1_9EURO|nr:alpha/beta-hydrolase [Aspergillus fijiensis CBS 313.89]RAK73072.1 alpha/beta-hydrolase [Aspergillus fijiensis CBS 313.89]
MPRQSSKFMPFQRSIRIDAKNPNPKIAFDVYKGHPDKLGPSPNPIIVLHGFLGCREELRPISKILATELKRDVYNLDLRNHGESGTKWRHDYLRLALDIRGLMKENNLKNVSLVGNQMGAKTAMTLALYDPKLVTNIVSIDNSPVWKPLPPIYLQWLHAYRQILKMRITELREARRVMYYWNRKAGMRPWLLRNLEKHDDHPYVRPRIPQNILWEAREAMGEFPFREDDANRFSGPALFLRSRDSYYIPEDKGAEAIRSFFPTSYIEEVDYEGLHLALEEPELVANAAVEFLRNPMVYLADRKLEKHGGPRMAWQL